MLNLKDFISGFYTIQPIDDSILGIRLDKGIKPTNLGDLAWRWIKNIIKGGFDSISEQLIDFAISVGKPFGQLYYNAQYPYLQKFLRKNNNTTIVVHDGQGLGAFVIYPSANQETVIVEDSVIYPTVLYAIPPFIIHSDLPLSIEGRAKIISETRLLKFAGTRCIIDAPYPAVIPPEEELVPDEPVDR